MTPDFNPYDTPGLFFLVTFIIVVLWLVFTDWNSEPRYYEDTGSRQKSTWTSPDSRARKQRHYNRRKMEEAQLNGEFLKAEYYEERYNNSWADIPYEKDSFTAWKKRKEIIQWAESVLVNRDELEIEIGVALQDASGKTTMTLAPKLNDGDDSREHFTDAEMKYHKKMFIAWNNMIVNKYGGNVNSQKYL